MSSHLFWGHHSLLCQMPYSFLNMWGILSPQVFGIFCFLFLECSLVRRLHNFLFDLYFFLDVNDIENILNTQSKIKSSFFWVSNTFWSTIHLVLYIVIVFLAYSNIKIVITGQLLFLHCPLPFWKEAGIGRCLINICQLHKWIMYPHFLEISNSENSYPRTYCSAFLWNLIFNDLIKIMSVPNFNFH